MAVRAILFVGLAAASRAGAQSAAKQSDGVTFDLKSATVLTEGGSMTGIAGLMPSYTGRAVAVGQRVRIDIVDGTLGPLGEKGDYFLFDTTGMTIVHPAKHEFVAFPADVGAKAIEQMQAMGLTMTIDDSKVSMDSIPGTDTIGGIATRHFRMTMALTMTIEAIGTTQHVKSETTNDYWMAATAGLTPGLLEQTAVLTGQSNPARSMTGPFKDIAMKADSAMRAIRMHGTPIRSKTSTRSDPAGGGGMATEATSEISNIRQTKVDESLFVIPANYTKGASPLPSGG
jgi:hypothetical protein